MKHARDERRKTIIEKKYEMEDRLRKIRMEERRKTQQHANRERQSKRPVGLKPVWCNSTANRYRELTTK